jgi:hypothetical protein
MGGFNNLITVVMLLIIWTTWTVKRRHDLGNYYGNLSTLNQWFHQQT